MSECLDDNLALALLDGKLPSARRTAVESHIESCPSCRELVVALAKDDSVIDSQVGVTTQASEVIAAMSEGPASAKPSNGHAGQELVR